MAPAGPAEQKLATSVSQRFGLKGDTALVTGGTRGLGYAIVAELCALGARVFTCGRDEATLSAALSSWRDQGFDVQGCVCDVSVAADRTRLMEQASAHFGGSLEILVNNAGSNIRKPFVEFTHLDFQSLMSLNLESAFHLSQLAYPLLKASGRGSIVMSSSVAGGPAAIKTGAIYAMSKAAMNQLTRNLACDWAPDNIRANAVAPWYIRTELAQQVLANETYRDSVVNRTPMGRVGEPEEVAGVVAFLAGRASSYVTGQVIAIDGAAMINAFGY